MKRASFLVTGGLLALLLAACGDSNNDNAQAGTTFCFNCHSETTALGQKILWAQAGFEESVHAKGQIERLYTQLAPSGATVGGTYFAPVADPGQAAACVPAASTTAEACTQVLGGTGAGATCVVPAGVTQTACDTAGGTWLGPRFILAGTEHTGSNAFYANASGCQVCHTADGFRKRVAGDYDEAGIASVKFGWDPKVFAPTTKLMTDTIEFPSPIGCFACHTPHGIGTTDNEHLDQTVPVGTAVTTQIGSVYGNASAGIPKAKGHICAECHQVELNSTTATTPIASILGSVTGSGTLNAASYFGPHHGPQADMLMGKGGMAYAGTASGTGGSYAFPGTYGNSAHQGLADADCVSCHMQSDYTDINVAGRFGVNPAVGGHSFTNKGIVHGSETALVFGCGSRTAALQCHSVSGVTGSGGNAVKAARITRTNGYLQAGDALFQKYTDAAGTTDSNYHLKVNELLSKLANPATGCTGLLNDAAILAGTNGATPGTGMTWSTMEDGTTIDPRCLDNGARINKVAAPADDNTSASVRFLKAFWNFKFVNKEDKSFGVHNTVYALELLYDSCVDLAVLTGKPTGAAYCNGAFVTARP